MDRISATPTQVLVPIQNGTCGMDIACISSTLEKIGARVTLASVSEENDLVCVALEGHKIWSHQKIEEIGQSWDVIVIPGGNYESETPFKNESLHSLLQTHVEAKKPIGFMGDRGNFSKRLGKLSAENQAAIQQREDDIIYAQDYRSRVLFVLHLGEILLGKEATDSVAKRLWVIRPPSLQLEVNETPVAPNSNDLKLPVSDSCGGKDYDSNRMLPTTRTEEDRTTELIEEIRDSSINERDNPSSPQTPSSRKKQKLEHSFTSQNHVVEKVAHACISKRAKEGKLNVVSTVRLDSFLFENLFWPDLQALGWYKENGTRKNDFYYFPTGVSRRKGFRTRVDFFDSVRQVFRCCREKDPWKDMSKVKQLIKLMDTCNEVFMETRRGKKKKGPDYSSIVEEARKRLEGAPLSVSKNDADSTAS